MKRHEVSRLLIILVFAIFISELGIMLLLRYFPNITPYKEALIDSILLVFLVFPLLYIMVFRSMKREIAERERINSALVESITELEKAKEGLRRAKESAEAANRAKSRFLSNMSHELRTPLNAIIGFSEVLKDETVGRLNDKQKEYVGDVYKSGRHLLSLINDILDFSKIEAGKMELKLSNFDLKAAIESALFMIKEETKRRHIAFSLNIKNNLGTIKADSKKLEEIIFNLLSNAAKFTPDGGRIGIGAERKEGEALVSVWDTGIGIEEKDRSRIFKEFEQVDSEYARKFSGTGLGLAITKKFVELHGGKIWFKSEGKNKGTCFYFTLPIK